MADLGGRAGSAPPPWETDRRRHCTPEVTTVPVLYYGDAIASYKQVTYSDASIIISLFKHVLQRRHEVTRLK